MDRFPVFVWILATTGMLFLGFLLTKAASNPAPLNTSEQITVHCGDGPDLYFDNIQIGHSGWVQGKEKRRGHMLVRCENMRITGLRPANAGKPTP